MKKIKGLIIYLLILITTFGATTNEAKNVLVINSYGYDFSLTEKIMKGILDSFEEKNVDVNFEVEFLDTRKMLDQTYYSKLAEMYKDKFKYTKFDVIICSDNEALFFIEKNRIELFNGVPVIFCGINGYEKSLLQGDKNVTGITEELGITETVESALKLHKDIKNLLVLNDKTESGKMFRRHLNSIKIENSKLVFHSLRKFTNDYFQKSGVDFEPRCQFFGHEVDNVNLNFYTNKFTAGELFKLTQKIQMQLFEIAAQ